jgi:ABC-type glycerol-3-phosphate transport system substrate-binding protein
MKLNRSRMLLIGAASLLALCCGLTAQAYDAEFDYNGDGVVDAEDMESITAAFNTGEGDLDFNPIFDHDGDGFVTGQDIALALAAAD